MLFGFFIHSAAVVANLDNYMIRPGLTFRHVQFDPRVLFIHGLSGINEKIDQNMLKGVGVGWNGR